MYIYIYIHTYRPQIYVASMTMFYGSGKGSMMRYTQISYEGSRHLYGRPGMRIMYLVCVHVCRLYGWPGTRIMYLVCVHVCRLYGWPGTRIMYLVCVHVCRLYGWPGKNQKWYMYSYMSVCMYVYMYTYICIQGCVACMGVVQVRIKTGMCTLACMCTHIHKNVSLVWASK